LAGAINGFDGGLILVSHDFRLISQVAKEIWVCEKKVCPCAVQLLFSSPCSKLPSGTAIF
jgi:ATPase subunit of ABC transporter with duplicated ATPase domains